jgi:uncharacterized membrane protein
MTTILLLGTLFGLLLFATGVFLIQRSTIRNWIIASGMLIVIFCLVLLLLLFWQVTTQ